MCSYIEDILYAYEEIPFRTSSRERKYHLFFFTSNIKWQLMEEAISGQSNVWKA